MNILPKKRWHVRNKDNIARVRRDEANAEEERKSKEKRQKLAEKEARTQLLRERSRLHTKIEIKPIKNDEPAFSEDQHINFFQDCEEGNDETKTNNKEYEKEIKEEKEKYEKQIGYLTYLGQDTNEALGKKSWYELAPKRNLDAKEQVNLSSKIKEDPLEIMKKYLPTDGNVKKDYSLKKNSSEYNKTTAYNEQIKKIDKLLSKKPKKYKKKKSKKKHFSSESEDSDSEGNLKRLKLESLRKERLEREQNEKRRAEILLKQFQKPKLVEPEHSKQKYNSQFNPYLARQNYE